MEAQPSNWLKWLAVIGGAVLLCFWAFYNHYPLLNPDTGTYLFSGYKLEVPNDRPIFYGLFVRATSLSTTGWFTIAVQSLMVSGVLYLFLKHFTPFRHLPLAHLLLLIGLTFATGLSVSVSQIMPDIFTPLAFLCIALLLFASGLSRWRLVFLFSCLFISLIAHNSHLLICLLLVFAPLAFISGGNATP